jgi:hypothetical protein
MSCRQVNLPASAFVPAGPRPRRVALNASRSGALGTNANISSPSPRLPAAVPLPGSVLSPIVRRFALQAGAKELLHGALLKGKQIWSGEVADLKSHRVCHCLRRVQDVNQGVAVRHHPAQKAGSLGNLQTCASVWACPVCSAKITERRRGEVRTAIDEARGRGLCVVMLTRTVSHKHFETIREVVDLLRRSMNRLSNGKAAQTRARRWGIVGHIRSLEVTHGANGWHPHFHELLFLEPGYDLQELRESMRLQWSAAVRFAGGRALSEQHGFDAVDCDRRIADYVAKFGREPDWQEDRELAKSPSKLGKNGGRTPLQLLNDYVFERDVEAGWVWREYALVMTEKRMHQLQWSRGLKALFGIAQKDDEQIEQEITADAVHLATIPVEEWRLIVKRDLRARVLELAAAGDFDGLNDFLNLQANGVDLVQQQRREHGWRVKPKNLREQTDVGICWQVEQLFQKAELFGWRPDGEAAENAQAMQQAKEALAKYQRVVKEGGKVTTRH